MKIKLQQAADVLQKADEVLVLSHKSPDGDTLGSASALCTVLQRMGKHVRFACSDPVVPKYENLFAELKAEDFEPKFIVAVDIADTQLLGKETEQYKDRIDLAIDHHMSHKEYAKMSYVDSTAASTTQVIYELFCMMGVTIDKQIANCLYTGLCTDTGCFRYSNTSAITLRIAASLMDAGADAAEINRIMFDTKSRARLNVERLAMESITFYENGRFDIMEITEEMMKQSGATEGDIEGLAALPRQVEGVLIAATLREKKEGGYKISVRATPPHDASAICAQFGGGGHKGAAGCVIEDEKENVKKRLAEAVSNYFRSQGML